MYLGVLVVIYVTLIGCASYKGSTNSSVPVSEQALLKIEGGLHAVKFDGKSVLWVYPSGVIGIGRNLDVMIPAGEHTFTFDYLTIITSTGGSIRTRTTTIAQGLTATGTFEAGNTYAAVLKYNANKVYVQILLIKKEEPKNKLNLYESQYVNGAAFSSTSGGYYTGFTVGMVSEDEKRRTAWNVETGFTVGAGLTPLEFLGFDFQLGANYEYYFNRKGNIGIDIGGGMVYPFMLAVNGKAPLHPYVRIGMPFIINGMKLNLYGSYFFRDLYPDEKVKQLNEGEWVYTLNRFGFGATLSF